MATVTNLNFLSVLVLMVLLIKPCLLFRCDRRPYGSTTQASAPDGRFKLAVIGTDSSYIPEQVYTVQITATDEDSRFSLFMISAEGDMKPDERNPRRMITLDPGEVSPMSQESSKYNLRCQNTVEQVNSAPKQSVEVYWRAPLSGSGCVTLRAMVAENEELWYEDGAPLTARLCEDLSQPDDVAPVINMACDICDEAKYEISFTGIWSRNTHPVLYPENDWVPRFSELVGASHSPDYMIWTPGTLASEGLQALAEYANSSMLEVEIREKIGDGVRTLIKGKGHGYGTMTTPAFSFFRTDKINHLVTVAVALSPSPDWFLGISRFDLCTEENTWLEERELNLFPWDAGTDSGVSYESPNMPTYPKDAIDRVDMSSMDRNSPFFETDMKDLHPFGKLNIKLIRTYARTCEDATEEGETPPPEEGEGEGPEEPSEPEEPSRYQTHTSGGRRGEAPIELDPDSAEDCPMSQWMEWSPCEGICEKGRVRGYRWRERYHLVDGKPAEKYDPDNPDDESSSLEVSEYCKSNYETFDKEPCKGPCDVDEDLSAQRRIMPITPVAPGHGWKSKRRELTKPQPEVTNDIQKNEDDEYEEDI